METSSTTRIPHGVRGFFRFAHIDGHIAADPAVYVRLPKVHADETRTQGLDRLELIRFLQVAQTISAPRTDIPARSEQGLSYRREPPAAAQRRASIPASQDSPTVVRVTHHRLPDRWHSRDFPVLFQVARLLDAGEMPVISDDIAANVGHDEDDVIAALQAIHGTLLNSEEA